MHLTSLKLREFTAFSRADLEFVPGVNVFIGENGTGKTHVMKLAYAVLRAVQQLGTKPTPTAVSDQLRERLAEVFRPDEGQLRRLVRKTKAASEMSLVELRADIGLTAFSIGDGLAPLQVNPHRWLAVPRSLFIPTHDLLAMFKGFRSLYKARALSVEETFYDLCEALGLPEERVPSPLLEQITSKMLDGDFAVKLVGEQFYIDTGVGGIEAHLCAEGIRKIATIARLVETGSLTPGSVLFWDEPETNLNPSLIVKVADLLRTLATSGVQVVVTTHDYLLSEKLSLAVDTGQEPRVPTRFFSFHREEQQTVVESGGSLADIEHNAIVREYRRQYQEELDRFSHATGASETGGDAA